MKRIVLPLVITAFFISTSALQAQVKLEHKFPDGRKTTTNAYTKVEQTLSIAGMDIPTLTEQNITTTEVNGKRQADGTLVSENSIDSLQTTLNVAGMELKFDSVNPDAPPPGTALDVLIDVFKAVAKSRWTVTYGANNKAVAVKGRADTFQGLSEAVQASLSKQFSEEYLTKQVNQGLSVLPDGPVKQGDTWERQEHVLFDSYQSMDFTTTYKYEGTVQKDGKSLDKISSKTTKVTYTMDPTSPSPLKIVDSELTVESDGTILFDRAAGSIVETKDKKHISGTLKCEVNGTEIPGSKLDLVFETSTNRE